MKNRVATPRPALAATLAAAALVLTACSGSESDGPSPRVAAEPALPAPAPAPERPEDEPGSAPATLPSGSPGDVEVVASGLDHPWSILPLTDGGALVSERDTALVRRVAPDGSVSTLRATGPGGEVAGVTPRGEGGLLGLALAPGDDPLGGVVDLYAFTTTADDGRVMTMALDLRAGTLGAPETIIDGFPSRQVHHGGRLEFGADGMLFIGVGDAGEKPLAQDADSLAGKILRVAPDGSVPADNPDPGSPVWTSGHRNVQGIGWDAQGRMLSSEFGQDTADELNLVEAGENYGWPDVEGFGGERAAQEGFVEPLVTWRPADASPSGVAITADAVYVAALRGQRLWRVPTAGASVGEPEAFFEGEHGRLRDVTLAPDGSLLVITDSSDGQLLRIPLVG